MTLTNLDRVIINRMALVNKHDYDGFDEVHTHNKQKFKNYKIKNKKKIQQAFLLIYYILLLKGLHTCATRNIYVFKISFYQLRVQNQCIEINEDKNTNRA